MAIKHKGQDTIPAPGSPYTVDYQLFQQCNNDSISLILPWFYTLLSRSTMEHCILG